MAKTIQNEHLRISVQDFGAVLCSVQSAKSGHEFLWQGNPVVWNGQSPV